MTIKVNGVSKETITFTVMSNDEQWAVYKNWKPDVIAEIWDNSMNDLDKITALVDFINTNYKYSASCCSYYGFALGYSGDCIAAADLVIDFAKELGYSGELISTNYAVATHRAARIYIGSTYYDVDVWANVIYNSAGKAVYMNGKKTSYWPE